MIQVQHSSGCCVYFEKLKVNAVRSLRHTVITTNPAVRDNSALCNCAGAAKLREKENGNNDKK